MNWKPFALYLLVTCAYSAATPQRQRREAEYYVAAYARHYNVPVEFVRAVGRAGIGMATMPCLTQRSRRLDAVDAANCSTAGRSEPLRHQPKGGVRYLAWLMNKFHGDLRLVAAAYYAGEKVIERRGLEYSNADVVAYVASVRERVAGQKRLGFTNVQRDRGRTR